MSINTRWEPLSERPTRRDAVNRVVAYKEVAGVFTLARCECRDQKGTGETNGAWGTLGRGIRM
jgi:hypothetical protein